LYESYPGAWEQVKNDDLSAWDLETSLYPSNSLSFLAFLIAYACESLLK
jgi:hypothetical protein